MCARRGQPQSGMFGSGRKFCRSCEMRRQRGATSIEYALIGALIAVVIVAAVTVVGSDLGNLFVFVAGEVSAAVSGTGN